MTTRPVFGDVRPLPDARLVPTWLRTGGLLLGLFLAGCFSERSFGAYNRSTHTWNTPSGIKVEDRVSKHLIDPSRALKFEYLGDIYYFENTFDVDMFLRDPGAYDYHGYAPLYGGGP
ncbi:MAG TPA: hypothetical protein VKW04_17835 [Planctomycetota bacterium]|nr:hypothetical protein [Planctomycetota bacterium]